MTHSPDIARLAETVTLLEEEPLRRHTSFRVGGPAQYLALPQTREQVRGVLAAARAAGLPLTVLGGGSNFLVSDQGVRGMVLGLKKLKSTPGRCRNNGIETQAGQSMAAICRFAAEQGLSGLEFMAGIPGTVGGAVAMNAGGAQSWIGDRVQRLTVVDPRSGNTETLEGEQLCFEYRHLPLDGRIILAMELALTQGNPDAIQAETRAAIERKKASQPVSQASGGCFFKNPSPDMPAGKLIDQAGLKGEELNGAMVSKVHANFIVNTGNARCRDILELADRVRDRVRKAFDIELENEVKVFGHA